MIYLTPNEQKRFAIIKASLSKKITNAQVATHLGVSIRQVQRLKAAVRDKGEQAVIHGLRNKPSNRRNRSKDI